MLMVVSERDWENMTVLLLFSCKSSVFALVKCSTWVTCSVCEAQ